MRSHNSDINEGIRHHRAYSEQVRVSSIKIRLNEFTLVEGYHSHNGIYYAFSFPILDMTYDEKQRALTQEIGVSGVASLRCAT